MKTLKDLKALKKVKAKRLAVNMYTIEDIDLMRDKLKEEILNKFGEFKPELWSENENNFIYNNLTCMKPKIEKQTEGEIEFRSKDYVFHYNGKSSYGSELKASMLTDYGFKVETFSGGVFEYYFIKQFNEGV